MEQKQRGQYTDEIDLRQFFNSIGNFFVNIWKGILNFIIGIRKATFLNKRIFVISIFILIILTILYKILFPPVYETSMLIRSSYIDSRYLDNEIEKLNTLAEEKDRGQLQQLLNVDSTVASKVIEFEILPYLSEEEIFEIRLTKEKLEGVEGLSPELIERLARYYEIENRRLFRVSVKIKDPSIVLELEDGFIQFLKGDEFIRRRIDIHKQTLIARKGKLIQESNRLDSLKTVLFENFASMAKQREQGSNNVILSDRYLTNPLEVFERDLAINEKILDIDRDLFLEPDFEVIDGFTTFNEPINPSWIEAILYAIIGGIIIAYIVIIFKYINSYLDKVERQGV